MFFDRRCPVCGRSHRTVCRTCLDQFELLAGMSAPRIDHLTPLFSYDDASSRLILAAKNGGRRDLLRWAGGHLGNAVAPSAGAGDIEVVTWVPAHPEQRRSRGYDQGQILAGAVASRLGVRSRRLLVRRGGSTRKGLGRVDRLAGPTVQSRRPFRGNVLLVDDVMATGASLARCADVLRSAGAGRVFGAVVAASTTKTPDRSAEVGSSIYIGTSSGKGPEAT